MYELSSLFPDRGRAVQTFSSVLISVQAKLNRTKHVNVNKILLLPLLSCNKLVRRHGSFIHGFDLFVSPISPGLFHTLKYHKGALSSLVRCVKLVEY